jgi:two-component system, cell cycle sensor histidine kinase and response regulator CckA
MEPEKMKKPFRVLIVEDSENDALLMANELNRGGFEADCKRVDTPKTMREALEGGSWDVVLADFRMPTFNAIDALNIVKEKKMDIPFIVVSGTIGEDTAVEAMRAGANDFFTKDKLTRLVPAVQRELKEAQLRHEHAEVQEKLEESQEKYRLLVENLGVGVSLISPEMKIVAMNRKMHEWFPAVDIAGKPFCYQAFNQPARTEACSYCPVVITLKDGMVHEAVTQTPTAHGVVNYRIVSTAIKDKTGQITAAIEVVEDITELKKAEDALKKAYTQLKETQAQLIQLGKMSAVGELAGGVAHEINNPLSGILNNVQLLKMEAVMKKDFKIDDFKELLEVIEQSALRCKNITDSLLSFSRASDGSFHPLSLNDMVEKVTGLIGHEMSLENIKFEKHLQPGLAEISGDPQLIQQVIFNLVSNAKWAINKKSGKSGGAIAIRTESEPGKKQVKLFLSDTGIGVSPENLAKIYEPFFTTKAVGEGTGLGLSIVYSIVKLHKGSIDIESELNKGTTFKIAFPAL